jgi:hypothetical protein
LIRAQYFLCPKLIQEIANFIDDILRQQALTLFQILAQKGDFLEKQCYNNFLEKYCFIIILSTFCQIFGENIFKNNYITITQYYPGKFYY